MEKEITDLPLDFEEDIYIFSDAIKSQIKPFAEYRVKNIFPEDKVVNVEIGIGNGEFICHMAEKKPEEYFLGFEVYRKIFRKAIGRVQKKNLKNIKIIQFDAGFFIPLLKDNSISNFYINFPDPWPKKKHNKRRLLKPEFIKLIKDKLVKNGHLYIATDHDDYAEEILLNLKTVPELKPIFPAYFVNELIDYYPTKYYRKFAIHNKVYFFKVIKK